MKNIITENPIISALACILWVLFWVAISFGCKDKAEAEEWIWTTDPNDLTAMTFAPGDPNDPNRVFLKWDSESPNRAIYCPKCDALPEPSEPKVEPAANWIEAVERWPNAQGYITDNFGNTWPMSSKIEFELPEPNELLTLRFKEPNEPNSPNYLWLHPIAEPNWEYSKCSECGKKIHISKSHFCFTAIMKNIPTWPEYIELEKNLVFDNTDVPGQWPQLVIIYKGTKIYLKEDD